MIKIIDKKCDLRLLGIILTVLIVFSLVFCFSGTAEAAESEAYTYTVRIFAGAQGTINGGSVAEYTGLKAGDVVSFDRGSVSLKDNSKYYVSGIRESGKDNFDSDHPQLSAVTVTGDADYVVAYGILGDSVQYTVNYTDASGNKIAKSETYYGNVGDSPVIAFKYIEGYSPQAYNLTKTLSENSAANVFTFVYTLAPVKSGEGSESGTGNNTTERSSSGNEETAEEGTETGEATDTGVTTEPEEIPEIINLDDEDAPLAKPESEEDSGSEGSEGREADSGSGFDFTWLIPVIIIAAAVVAILLVVFARRKKKDSNDDIA